MTRHLLLSALLLAGCAADPTAELAPEEGVQRVAAESCLPLEQEASCEDGGVGHGLCESIVVC